MFGIKLGYFVVIEFIFNVNFILFLLVNKVLHHKAKIKAIKSHVLN